MAKTKKSERPRAAAATAAAAFAVAAPTAYLIQRLYELARGARVDPLLVLREAHTAFYWRAGAAAWWGGVVAVLVFVWASRGGGEVPRWAQLLVIPFAFAVFAIAWAFP